MNFLANSGAYMFDPKIINLIPTKKFDVNELVILAKKKNESRSFSIGEGNWFDVDNGESTRKQ